jgi:hypothetical protein
MAIDVWAHMELYLYDSGAETEETIPKAYSRFWRFSQDQHIVGSRNVAVGLMYAHELAWWS